MDGSGGGSVMPPTSRTSGTPTRRKTTRAERGLPGSPITGTPPQSASSVGLPGRMAMPVAQIPGAPRPATAAAVSSRAPTDDPADTTTTSLLGDRVAQHRGEALAVVGDDAEQVGLAARVADERRERERASRRAPGPPRATRCRGRRPRRRSTRSPPAAARGPRPRSRPPRRAGRGPARAGGVRRARASAPRAASSSRAPGRRRAPPGVRPRSCPASPPACTRP